MRTKPANTITFHSYTERFLLEIAQVEVTVSASPVGPHIAQNDGLQGVLVQFKNYDDGTALEVDTDSGEFEAFAEALLTCARAISLTPEEQVAYLKNNHDSKEQE